MLWSSALSTARLTSVQGHDGGPVAAVGCGGFSRMYWITAMVPTLRLGGHTEPGAKAGCH